MFVHLIQCQMLTLNYGNLNVINTPLPMTNKIIFTFLLLSLFFSCKTNSSIRGGSIMEVNTFLFVQVVEYKDSSKDMEVNFDMEHENIINLEHFTFQMYFNNGSRQII